MKRFEIAPEIEIFDLSHIHGTKRLIDVGLMSPKPHVQFVMGVQNALPADERLLDVLLAENGRWNVGPMLCVPAWKTIFG
jgi:3-keto-5-aminohexanoate cleavage enzyme